MREIVVRRTTMLFTVYPPTTELLSWLDYVKRFSEQMSFILWCRVVRKTPRERIVGDIEFQTRQLRAKWHDRSGTSGVIEATAIWEVKPDG